MEEEVRILGRLMELVERRTRLKGAKVKRVKKVHRIKRRRRNWYKNKRSRGRSG